jgi:hypothetical protein
METVVKQSMSIASVWADRPQHLREQLSELATLASPLGDASRDHDSCEESPRSTANSRGVPEPVYLKQDHYIQLPPECSECPSKLPGMLPEYIQPLPEHLDHNDLDYLIANNALTVPGDELRNALLKAYMEHIHHFFPIIDMQQFLQVIFAKRSSDQGISLLLYQAVMFASVPMASMDCLQEAGFQSPRDARESFYSKVQVGSFQSPSQRHASKLILSNLQALYKIKYESDPLSVIQALLLMSCWQDPFNQTKVSRTGSRSHGRTS